MPAAFSLQDSSPVAPDDPARNFGLTAADFSNLHQALVAGDEHLFEHVFLSHFEDCTKYIQTVDNMSKEDAYDATMAALIRFRDLLLTGKLRYGNLRYLLTVMARQSYRQTTRRQALFTELPQEILLLTEPKPSIAEDHFTTLARAFRSLGSDCRRLLIDYYYRKRSLKDIAQTAGREAAAVRKQKSRCVVTLKRLFHSVS